MSRSPGRESVPAARLYALLAEAFERSRDPNCRRCTMPLPVFRTPADPGGANWHTGMPRPCTFGCDLVIREVQAALWERYDMLSFDAAVRDSPAPGATPDPAQTDPAAEA
jgi:hypothetical protein